MDALPIGYKLQSPLFTYTIEKVLGHGNFGITYKATAVVTMGNIPTKMSFAIKEYFRNKLCMRDGDTKRVTCTDSGKSEVDAGKSDFRHEGKILQQLCKNSPYIVKVNEVFDANNTVYYVMQYLDGGSLREYCRKPLAEENAKRVLRCIASATQFLHDRKLLHLDLKPDNVVMTTGVDGKIIPVVIDFGMAKHFDEKGKLTSQSITSGYTDGYAPMEQYGGIKTFSPTADVYALGAILYFMLTGQDPIRAFELRGSKDFNLPNIVSVGTRQALYHAMASSDKERTTTPREFLKELEMTIDEIRPENGGGTVIFGRDTDKKKSTIKNNDDDKDSIAEKVTELIQKIKKPLLIMAAVGVVVFGIIKLSNNIGGGNTDDETMSEEDYALMINYENRVKAIVDGGEGSSDNFDSLMAAKQCVATINQLYEKYNMEYHSETKLSLDTLVNNLYTKIVKNGDATSVISVKRNCYEKAQQLNDCYEIRHKLTKLSQAEVGSPKNDSPLKMGSKKDEMGSKKDEYDGKNEFDWDW